MGSGFGQSNRKAVADGIGMASGRIHMDAEFINITTENLAQEHLCCIIRSKKPHPGIDAKRQWLSDRLKEGHVFRKLNAAKATVCLL